MRRWRTKCALTAFSEDGFKTQLDSCWIREDLELLERGFAWDVRWRGAKEPE